ncbi:putative C-type lectin domain family 20 member A isoform X2 [Acanthopagrus latus]|uniref:putative C-type lectin domain family 20 member A isoform X2 n=1 Tax=Acanthopagrus latus TaxID=8177 RepID=UPI00187C5E39|nr:putative C-type lectin domain family 20 member A isoform X2 [Acanthopagrus latus]
MDLKLFVVFFHFGFGLTSCYHLLLREYHYVNVKLSWADAQQYCRDKYTDLATIVSTDDIRRLNRPNTDSSPAWIGLSDHPKSWKGVMGNDPNSWRWSVTGNTSTTGYHNWGSTLINNAGGNQDCALVEKTGQWNDFSCLTERRFVCYTATNPAGQKTYTLIDNNLNWEDARSYCRTHYTDLAMIENAQEQADLESAVMSIGIVWIGLYRVPWTWSDKSSSSFRNWKSSKPDNYGGSEHCAFEDSNHLWEDTSCGAELPFFCHVLTIKLTIVRMKIQTDGDLSDPATNAQILQQLLAVLKSKTLQTDINLRIQPIKQDEDSEANG